jgi:C1A family cysteine protease
METLKGIYATGWLRDFPDLRDYNTASTEVSEKRKKAGQDRSIKDMLHKIGVQKNKSLPEKFDLSEWCSPIEDQQDLGSCTANAGAALLEYFEKKSYGRYIDASRLFLYKTTRNLLKKNGDTGAYLRTTMQAIRLFGIVPEEYWPYTIDTYDDEPPSFCYSYAQNYRAISYYRLDSNGTTGQQLLDRIKTHIGAGLPSMFGFTVYRSISEAQSTGDIPFPLKEEKVVGGHAIVAVGFDDNRKMPNCGNNGALKIRNSWGTGWGQEGYGWLPYSYVLEGLAVDWWSLMQSEWVDSEQFQL